MTNVCDFSKFSAQYLPNYKANEMKLGSLLVLPSVNKSENLMALGRSLGEGGALKIAHFEKKLHVWRHLSA